MALTFFRPRGDVKANWKAANPILKEREMAIEWETAIGVGQPRIKFGKAGGTTHYNDTDYAVLPLKYNTKDGWATDNPILANGEMGIEWETTIGEGAVCIKFGNGTTAWNDLEYASTGRLKEIIEPETENSPIAVGDTLPMIAGKLNNQQDYLKTKLGYDRLDALAAKLSGLSNQDFVGIMDFINDKKFDKTNVYNGVDSTNTELALAASQGKTLHDQITTLNSNLDALNTGILAGAIIFPKLEGTGNQKVNVKFGKTLPQKPIIIVSWCDTQHVDTYCSGLTVCERSTTSFTVSMNRITANSSAWYASWIAVIR